MLPCLAPTPSPCTERRPSRSPLPLALQLLALSGLVLLAISDWRAGVDPSASLTPLVVWGLWWPGLIALALVFDRAVCTACPLTLVNRLGARVARLGLPRLHAGKVLAGGWVAVAIHLSLQLLMAVASIQRAPHVTALLVTALVGLAFAAGAVFGEPSSFCQTFCPAGAVLSMHGRVHDPRGSSVLAAPRLPLEPLRDPAPEQFQERLGRGPGLG